MRVHPLIQESSPVVKFKLLSGLLVVNYSACVGDWHRTVSTHVGAEGTCFCSTDTREKEGARRCLFLYRQLRAWRGGARLVASWPPAPDGCIIDAHPAGRRGPLDGVKCDGGRERLGRNLNLAGGRV